MKKSMPCPTLINLLLLSLLILTSCASNKSQCPAYTYATPENENVEIDTKTHVLEPVASKGLEKTPQSFQWADNLTGPNGGRLY